MRAAHALCTLRMQMNPVVKKEIITALTARWVASDGLEVHQVTAPTLVPPPSRTAARAHIAAHTYTRRPRASGIGPPPCA